MKGRPPKPAALREIDGNTRHRKITRGVTAPASTPNPPAWLQGDALTEWNRIVPALAEMGLLCDADQFALAICCQTVADYAEAVATVAREGKVLYTETNGAPFPHPAETKKRQLATLYKSYIGEFGLSPVARERLSAKPAADAERDGAKKFLFGQSNAK